MRPDDVELQVVNHRKYNRKTQEGEYSLMAVPSVRRTISAATGRNVKLIMKEINENSEDSAGKAIIGLQGGGRVRLPSKPE